MPLFDYKCESCGKEFTKLIITSETNPKCPSCNGDTKKIISLPSKPKHSSDSWR